MIQAWRRWRLGIWIARRTKRYDRLRRFRDNPEFVPFEHRYEHWKRLTDNLGEATDKVALLTALTSGEVPVARVVNGDPTR